MEKLVKSYMSAIAKIDLTTADLSDIEKVKFSTRAAAELEARLVKAIADHYFEGEKNGIITKSGSEDIRPDGHTEDKRSSSKGSRGRAADKPRK